MQTVNLVGRSLPSLTLQSTTGEMINPAAVAGVSIFFCYPYTGRPGVPDPEGWDHIPGAHGSTPQAQGYSRVYDEFRNHGVSVFGLSFQEPEWQRECVERLELKVPLVSDGRRQFAATLDLPTFMAGQQAFIRRTTLVARDGVIIHAFQPAAPEKDAEQVLSLVCKS